MPNPSPLAKKLQIKPNHRVLLLSAPADFAARLEPLPDGVTLSTSTRGKQKFDVVHLFVKKAKDHGAQVNASIDSVLAQVNSVRGMLSTK